MNAANGVSLECVSSRDAYPPKMPSIVDDDSLQLPLPLLPGEQSRFLGSTGSGLGLITNYRAVFTQKMTDGGVVIVPLGLVELVEARDMFSILLLCKDGQAHILSFSTNEYCSRWLGRLKECTRPARTFASYFACAFRAWQEEDCSSLPASVGNEPADNDARSAEGYSFWNETERLGFDTSKAWRIAQNNDTDRKCETYPEELIVPRSFGDDELKESASFRTMKRFPTVVWRNKRSGSVLVRSSQPACGLLAWRNPSDERLLQAIVESAMMGAAEGTGQTTESKRLLVVDARSYTAAVANRAKGGGCEFPEYYVNCDIEYMGLANIHQVRKSFVALRGLLYSSTNTPESDNTSWLTALDSTRWLCNVGLLLKAASFVAKKLVQPRSVLVHCSDGWDRTPQIVSLAEMLLDPFYRTYKGFRCLIEKEWLEFGHKFADRCGHSLGDTVDQNEMSPVFLQWLDCVHQIVHQFPCAFEFSEDYLVKLAEHTYSCMFGTFLFNTYDKKTKEAMKEKTLPVWAYLSSHKDSLRNILYRPKNTPEILDPSWHPRDLRLWLSLYQPSRSHVSSPLDKQWNAHASLPDGSAAHKHTCRAALRQLSIGDTAATNRLYAPLQHCSTSVPTYLADYPGVLKRNQPPPVGTADAHLSENGIAAVDEQYETGDEKQPPEPVMLNAVMMRPDYVGPDGLLHRGRADAAIRLRLTEAEDQVRHLECYIQSLRSRLSHRHHSGSFQPADDKLIPMHCLGADVHDGASSGGSGASEGSWEDVDYEDVGVTMWVPDDQVSHCSGCNQAFGVVLRRKHHCRNCGNVYCYECAGNYMPLPQQQLYNPVRVCRRCYDQLSHITVNSNLACKDASLQEKVSVTFQEGSKLAQVPSPPQYDGQSIMCRT